MRSGYLGQMVSRAEGKRPIAQQWAADNGCFKASWKPEPWLDWLNSLPRAGCLFAVCPDVLADCWATFGLSHWLSVIRGLGFPAAFVAQDGATTHLIPWAETDVLFIGGSTEFKLSPEAAKLAAEANERGLQVHMGRVNSGRRWKYAAEIGAASVDGTFLAIAPETNLARLIKFAPSDVAAVEREPRSRG